MATPDLSDADLLSRLKSALRGDADKVPEGHRTRDQWEQKWGLAQAQAGRLLKAGIAKGIMGAKSYRIPTRGGIKSIPHFFEL